MGKVMFDISMSLDGLITGPNVSPEQPLGKGASGVMPERLVANRG